MATEMRICDQEMVLCLGPEQVVLRPEVPPVFVPAAAVVSVAEAAVDIVDATGIVANSCQEWEQLRASVVGVAAIAVSGVHSPVQPGLVRCCWST